MKKKLETKSIGPLRDEEAPWNGITLNRCLVVAAIAALLSMGFQVLQDAVDSDDITEIEDDAWTQLYENEQLAEPWFFESWFGISKVELPAAEEPQSLDIKKTKPQAELEETPTVEQSVSTVEKKAKVKEIQADSLTQKLLVSEKVKDKKAKEKPSEQWGLKAKDKHIAVKAAKTRRETDEGLKKGEVLPFPKKLKEFIKSHPVVKETSNKEKKYQKKYGERVIDRPKKQEFGKSFKKEQNKYYRQEKGHRGDTKNNPYHKEKDYKKKQDRPSY